MSAFLSPRTSADGPDSRAVAVEGLPAGLDQRQETGSPALMPVPSNRSAAEYQTGPCVATGFVSDRRVRICSVPVMSALVEALHAPASTISGEAP